MKAWKIAAVAAEVAVFAGITALSSYFTMHWDHRNLFFNLGEVVPGTLYRSGQLKPDNFQDVVDKYGIKTIVCLRGKEDSDVSKSALQKDVKILGIELTAKRPPGPEQLALIFKALSGARFRPADYAEIIRQQQGMEGDEVSLPPPYLIHCAMGSDRTGYIIALYRICFQGWPPDKARMEMLRYLHFPPKYPRLWESLREVEPEKLCPSLNPEYTPDAGPRAKEGAGN